jgi:hypothetical protein
MISGTMGTIYHGLNGKDLGGQRRVGPLSLNTRARWPITKAIWKIDIELNLINMASRDRV